MFDRLLRATLSFMLILICINALQAGNAAEIIRRKSFPRPQKLINERWVVMDFSRNLMNGTFFCLAEL